MTGPYETERQARLASLWETRGRTSGMSIGSANLADLGAALAGVELGAYDRRIIDWLAGYEPATVAVVCGLVRRRAAASAAETGELVAEGNGPLLDPDCRDGKHTSCIGAPCECPCHRPQFPLADAGVIAAEVLADVHRLAGRGQLHLASCGHPHNEDGECGCSWWPERAPAGSREIDSDQTGGRP